MDITTELLPLDHVHVYTCMGKKHMPVHVHVHVHTCMWLTQVDSVFPCCVVCCSHVGDDVPHLPVPEWC